VAKFVHGAARPWASAMFVPLVRAWHRGGSGGHCQVVRRATCSPFSTAVTNVALSYQYISAGGKDQYYPKYGSSFYESHETSMERNVPGDKKLCVMVHGMLGQGKNLRTFAKRIVDKYPSFDVLLLDLRGHGSSPPGPAGTNDLTRCAQDVLGLFQTIGRQPEVLVGHSFGGKVALALLQEMVDQALDLHHPLGLPRTWIWDSAPGTNDPSTLPTTNATWSVLNALNAIKIPIRDKKHVLDTLEKHDVGRQIGMWMTTNLVPYKGANLPGEYEWAFDLPCCEELMEAYNSTDLYGVFDMLPYTATNKASWGNVINFVRAGNNPVWTDMLVEEIEAIEEFALDGEVGMHHLEDVGHWVHVEAPERCFELLDEHTLSKLCR
jgi:pimeloyl-ACP methyl ester carboxylesterase